MLLRNFFLGLLVTGGECGPPPKEERAVKGIRNQSFDLIKALGQYDQNIAISPLSIMGAMYMLAAGSAGESRAEILKVLQFDLDNGQIGRKSNFRNINDPFIAYSNIINSLTTVPEKSYILEIANAIFHQEGMGDYTNSKLSPRYVNLLQETFIRNVSNIQEVDFQAGPAATNRINKWISDMTKGKIPKLYEQPLGADTIVILASTLYFKASWKGNFELLPRGSPEAAKYCFVSSMKDLTNKVCQDVQWMTKEGDMSYFPINSGSKKIADVFEIPLKNKKWSTDDEEVTDKIVHQFVFQVWAPEAMLSTDAEHEDFLKVIKKNYPNIRKKMSRQLTLLTMPKFDIEYKENIMDALEQLGIEEVFGGGANLQPMLGDSSRAYVKHVNHAVKLTVDENGVEGAAVTTVGLGSRTIHTPTRLDITKPFYFVINNRCWTENSGTGTPCSASNVPLFMGRFVKPE